MNCKDFRKNIFDYLDGKLSPEDRQAIENHADQCEACEGILDRLMEMDKAITREKNLEPNAYSGTRILQRLEDAHVHHQLPGSIVLRPALITMGLIAALTAGYFVGHSGTSRRFQIYDENQRIETLRSSLFVQDFADEDITLLDNE